MRGRITTWTCLLLLLVAAVGLGSLWWRLDVRVKRLLRPDTPLYTGYADLPEKAQGVQIIPFETNGWDGTQVQACIVQKTTEADGQTPRQHALLDRLKGTDLSDLASIDYALVSVDWDHGIRAALPLAEELAAAGITCVLWEPRGSNSRRPWCTHGLRESRDVSAIIDALEERTGRRNLLIVGVGKGFGAGLMLQAAAGEPRLRAVVSVDATASLNKLLKRVGMSTPMRELIGWRMNQLTGLEPFDIAPVKSASLLPREVPVMLVHSGELPQSLLEDAVSIYTQLKSDLRKILTLRTADDAPDTTKREIVHVQEGGTREVVQRVEVDLADDADSLTVEILRWLNACVRPLQEEPAPTTLTPDR